MSIAISSGHSKYVAGAIGFVKEVEQARIITDRIADLLDDVMPIHKFHDDISRTQNENVNRIVAWHNKQNRKADYSIHLNASVTTTSNDLGVEVLYFDEPNRKHAEDLAKAISEVTGLKNRGAKIRKDLGFLRGTNKPAFLIEAYFVNSHADVKKMDEQHEINSFAVAVAKAICEQWGVTYQQAPNKPHRVKSGTFKTEDAANVAKQALDKHTIASAMYTKVYKDGDGWRFLTGTYASKLNADAAIKKMKELKILSSAYTIED